MVRGDAARFQFLPPHRTLPSTPVPLADAEKMLTAYLDKTDYEPHLHPDAILNAVGIQLSLSSGTEGGLTLHNLRRIQAGLRGEKLGPGTSADEDAKGSLQIQPAGQEEVRDEEDVLASEDEAAALEEDPLRRPMPAEEKLVDGMASDRESEHDGKSQYITTQPKETQEPGDDEALVTAITAKNEAGKKRKKVEIGNGSAAKTFETSRERNLEKKKKDQSKKSINEKKTKSEKKSKKADV
ncbi:hypothetical protein EJ05DRAFT_238350 [Pseudovirgaria hyperparasitica]|uniref:Uncharacterized protein n=1 Tax=Pseudovirgaria hyperparasitica TaxID=470096 RepID=A0A6A6VSP6_9PEZI|nr:uncharacterized protein EJ05DRAFT_238350 [Pseudovirgaria hyperparasitica]KAF2752806.1 hypothetical protein EJ05DRAFT_238350 [Pseudovirgaria hyperparasitica]